MFPDFYIRHRKSLRWIVPLLVVIIVAVYELGPAQWLHQELGNSYHFIAELLFYGTIGPLVVFLLLYFLNRWIEERETSDLQAKVLAEVREQVRISRGVNDQALQTLFAASALLASFQCDTPDQARETTMIYHQAEGAIDRAIRELRYHLESSTLQEQHHAHDASAKTRELAA